MRKTPKSNELKSTLKIWPKDSKVNETCYMTNFYERQSDYCEI